MNIDQMPDDWSRWQRALDNTAPYTHSGPIRPEDL